ncbi:hypothetical protein CBM2585_A50050 [Cupriavidus taiwanensis]|nr:hypothetical protein CBM2585_A50050 [Cupriavidus taiwanensis]
MLSVWDVMMGFLLKMNGFLELSFHRLYTG